MQLRDFPPTWPEQRDKILLETDCHATRIRTIEELERLEHELGIPRSSADVDVQDAFGQEAECAIFYAMDAEEGPVGVVGFINAPEKTELDPDGDLEMRFVWQFYGAYAIDGDFYDYNMPLRSLFAELKADIPYHRELVGASLVPGFENVSGTSKPDFILEPPHIGWGRVMCWVNEAGAVFYLDQEGEAAVLPEEGLSLVRAPDFRHTTEELLHAQAHALAAVEGSK